MYSFDCKGLDVLTTCITDEAMVAKTSNPLSYRGLVFTNIFCHDILVTEVYFSVYKLPFTFRSLLGNEKLDDIFLVSSGSIVKGRSKLFVSEVHAGLVTSDENFHNSDEALLACRVNRALILEIPGLHGCIVF